VVPNESHRDPILRNLGASRHGLDRPTIATGQIGINTRRSGTEEGGLGQKLRR
jgi:hypothetical protein